MNLKEAFRYQNCLKTLASEASLSITSKDHCLITTINHYKKKANPEAEDVVETLLVDEYVSNNDMLRFLTAVLEERYSVAEAITRAKATISFDIDAELSRNRMIRSDIIPSLKGALRYKPAIKKGTASDFKFNAEGNQTPYVYETETITSYAFDEFEFRSVLKNLRNEADEWSSKIDTAMVTTEVDFDPAFDINASFDEVVAEFLHK